MNRRFRLCLAIGLLLLCLGVSVAADELRDGFVTPPEDTKPWVYWFWLNGNITREGITADLEAMKRVGIGGVLIMEVDQGSPPGPISFMGKEWRELFQHVVAESRRLGLKVNMNNDAGWNGSGGPWIKPEQSMQKVVWSEAEVVGPKRFEGALIQPQTVAGFYRDIAVLAVPTPGSYRIPGIETKAAYQTGYVGAADTSVLAPEMVIDRARVINITAQMDASGRLTWDVPEGKWTLLRFGRTSTGAENGPAPASGRGLDCDKLSTEGAEANFNGMMAKLIADVGTAAGKTLVATHVDSWEIGSQNWTALMREEFSQRRGYDPLPFLPVFTGRVVGSLEISERFLWDLRRTISELIVEKYAAHIRKLAHKSGLKFTIEAYGSPCDSIPYAGEADEPMGEFWTGGGAMETCKAMASAGHVYGKRIIGAEAFTAWHDERWRHHPGSIKSLGDQAFCHGINRFVFHRYALQPWVPERKPGMTMGPWGLHYERTQTWWEQTVPWHRYLSRCHFLLRQGLFVADICYLQPETPPHGPVMRNPEGYKWDDCSAEVVLTRMSVKNGRIVLPDGMSYRLLVLPDFPAMTPALLRKIKELVEAGATVLGPRPLRSPSLSGYPECDAEVKSLAGKLWGDCDGKRITEHRLGKGCVVWGPTPEKLLQQLGVQPDFTSRERLGYIHRAVDGTDIYFVANPRPQEIRTIGTFRVSGKLPEFWWPESGRIERAPVFEQKKGSTSVMLALGPDESVFVVFREKANASSAVAFVSHNGRSVLSTAEPARSSMRIVVEKAVYGILDDPRRTRDVRAKAQKLVDGGQGVFQVARLAEGDDPAFGIVKTVVLEYSVNGKRVTLTGTDPDTLDLISPEAREPAPCELHESRAGLTLTAWQTGRFTLTRRQGKPVEVFVSGLPEPLKVDGPWEVSFLNRGGPREKLEFPQLTSWTEHPDSAVKYYSGRTAYRTTFQIPDGFLAKGRRVRLDLGNVQVVAEVKLNGRELGTLWKPPFRIEVTNLLKPGANELEVRVTNLLPNRMIGDELLPQDCERNPDGTLKSWPQWLSRGKPSPAGRFTFTSWRLWSKDDTLLKSGLLGPVTLQAGVDALVR